MSDAVEAIDVFEVYRRDFTAYRSGDPSMITVSGGRFSRTVFRPKEGGPDLLVDQFVENSSTYAHAITLGVTDLESKERFRETIVANPPLLRVQPDAPNWDWSRAANCICDFVAVDKLPAGVCFILDATEAVGKLSIIEEDNGWLSMMKGQAWTRTHEEIPPLIDGACGLCKEATIGSHEINDLIRLYCGHVYHRNCIFPAIWREQVWATKVKIGCPTHCKKCEIGPYSAYSQVTWSWLSTETED